jgi:hypothetical protein
VQIAFGGGDVAVAHQPLDLVDLEDADRLHAERVAQIVTVTLSRDDTRELAWVAASAWGSDQALLRVGKRIDATQSS